MNTPNTPPTVHPLTLPGAIRSIVHLCGGRQIREQLPQVAAEMVSIEADAVQDIIDGMDSQSVRDDRLSGEG